MSSPSIAAALAPKPRALATVTVAHRTDPKTVGLLDAREPRNRELAPHTYRRTTLCDRFDPSPADLLRRDFAPTAPDLAWVGDITYVKTWTGWAFLATVIDCYSRKVVGFALAGHMRTDLIIDALRMAIVTRNPPPGVIFHADRGSQHTSDELRTFCRSNGVRPSVGRTGSCFDNAVAESFFATIKKELIHTRPWPTVDKLRSAVFEYIESYYNRLRRHSTIGYDTPIEYEKKYALTRLQAA